MEQVELFDTVPFISWNIADPVGAISHRLHRKQVAQDMRATYWATLAFRQNRGLPLSGKREPTAKREHTTVTGINI